MKYLIIIILFVLAAGDITAQKIDSASMAGLSPELKEEVNNYLHQAKKARTTGMVLSIGGGVIALGGAFILIYDLASTTVNVLVDPLSPKEDNSSLATTGGVLFGIGAATAIVSIPFFKKVHKNREAARAIVFAGNGVSLAPGIMMPFTQSAGIGLVVDFGKRR